MAAEINYRENLEVLSEESHSLLAQSRWLAAGRFAAIVCALAACYFGLFRGPQWLLLVALMLFAGFVFLVKSDQKHLQRRRRNKNLLRINREELDYLRGDFSHFRDGSGYIDPNHPFSSDLGLFGNTSLFQHLDRTATQGGKHLLAHWLMAQETFQVENKQKSVQELTGKMGFRQQFRATGMDVKEDPGLKHKLEKWLEGTNEKYWLLSLWLLIPLALVAVVLLVHFALRPTLEHFYWLFYAALANLLLVFTLAKRIKKEYRKLEGTAPSLLMYAEMLHLIEKEKFSSPMLLEVQRKISSDEVKAGEAFRKLSRIVESFDQIHNPLAALVTNALYHNHLHALRRLYNWKRKYILHNISWLENIAMTDALCSLGNYAFNHPEFSYPVFTGQPEYEATRLGHPLISKENRVTNDLSFRDYRIMILTGSNMAGKSTFLRTVGINLVLAKMGAPVCATSLKVYPFQLLTSMQVTDSLSRDESYFLAEVMRLKMLQEAMQGEMPSLVLLDEVLRGTNSLDKKEGTKRLLHKISGFKTTGILATHDIDIAEMAQNSGTFKAMYFESRFRDGELFFDYKLWEGICTTPNATALMESKGVI